MSQETIDITLLQDFFDKEIIPTIEEKPITFFDITGYPHYENVLSNIYAFYFNLNERHNLGDLFVRSLEEKISKKKEEKFYLGRPYDVHREFYTEKGKRKSKRIDILLIYENSAIIIENKVFRNLDNDLENYWKSIEDKQNKVGIIMTIKMLGNIPNANFINITHLEFLETVFSNLGNYILNTDNKHIVFLKELYQNIKKLTNPMDKELLKFFLEHKDKINEAVKLKNEIANFVKEEAKKVSLNLDIDVKNDCNLCCCYLRSRKNRDLMITIYFEELLEKVNGSVYLMIEIQGKLIKHKEEIKNQFLKIKEEIKNLNEEQKEKSEEWKNLELLMTIKENFWVHITSKKYEELEDIYKFSDFITDKIDKDGFLYYFKELEKFVDEKYKQNF